MKSSIPTLDQIKRAAAIVEKIAELEAELNAIFGGGPARRGRKPKAEKAVKAEKAPKADKKAGAKKREYNLSPEARARIAAAQKARWAKFKKKKKADAAPAQ